MAVIPTHDTTVIRDTERMKYGKRYLLSEVLALRGVVRRVEMVMEDAL
jgi:hypothetical protein